ncbi:MAG: hypothetical protein GEU99_11535 [Luteitalea sp.]|nr:hypothetical protein [Luteitalea sp.]
MSTARLIVTAVGMFSLSAGPVLAQPVRSFDEPFDLTLLMASVESSWAEVETQAEAARAQAEAQAEAVRAQAEEHAETVRAQVEAMAERERSSRAFFHGDGDFEYVRAISALDRGLYEEALSRLAKLSAERTEIREKTFGEGRPTVRKPPVRGPDAVAYWLAYTHYKLGRAQDALTTLSKLSQTWPDSGWRSDARALEIEIRQWSGQAVRPEAIEDEELRLLALQGLVRAGRPEATAALERILFGVHPPRVKERAIFVLAQNPSPKAREVMVKVIKGGANPDVQLVAVRYLAAIGPNSEHVLTDAYGSASDTRVKVAVISQLASKRNAKALVSLARREKDADLKKRIVERLATMKSKEATDYLLELVNK